MSRSHRSTRSADGHLAACHYPLEALADRPPRRVQEAGTGCGNAQGARPGLVAVWLPALRRMLKLFVVISVGTVVLSALFGLLINASIMRSIAIGFYLVGCFVLFGAFFFGNRGPIRPGGEDTGGLFRVTSRRLRWATKDEQEEAISAPRSSFHSALVLILLGVVWDTKHSLF